MREKTSSLYSSLSDETLSLLKKNLVLPKSLIPESTTKTSEITFTVYGIPQPQGSTRAFVPKGWTRPIITSVNKKNKPWRQEIASVALDEMFRTDVELFESEPVSLSVDFYFDKPKSTSKKIVHKVTKPDIDKCLRSVLDALTGVVFKDDSQVMDVACTKRFGSPARAEIRVGLFPFGTV